MLVPWRVVNYVKPPFGGSFFSFSKHQTSKSKFYIQSSHDDSVDASEKVGQIFTR